MKKVLFIVLTAVIGLVGLLASACFGDGIFRVGVDIQPGTYRNSDSSDCCYWERLSGLDGTLEEIIANNFTCDLDVVTISPTDVAFSSIRCGVWTLVAPVEPAPTVVPTAMPVEPTVEPTAVPIEPTAAPPSKTCCKICTTGKACGDSCISRSYTCHKPPGCACDG